MSTLAQPNNNVSTLGTADSPFRSEQTTQRSSKYLAPPGSSGLSAGALTSLARGSLMMGLSGEGNASSTSLGGASTHSNGVTGQISAGESSNTILAPNGVLVPRSSILLNRTNRRSFVDQWRLSDMDGNQPAPAVLRIPAVATLKEQKERELQREFERAAREKEIEREIREKEQAEKVWGIPRKAFYLGLGEINFNAQMAMMAGWGNGSGGMGVDVANKKPLTSKAARRKSAPVTTGTLNHTPKKKNQRSGRPSSSHSNTNRESMSSTRESVRPAAVPPKEPDLSDSDESIDLEELAALNAIINTRRSMEAAQILASGMYAARPGGALKRNTSSHEGIRKNIESNEPKDLSTETRQESQESVPMMISNSVSGTADSGSDNGSDNRPPLRDRNSSDQPSPLTAKIRFAPLPQAYSPSEPLANNENDTLPHHTLARNQSALESEALSTANENGKPAVNMLNGNSNGIFMSAGKDEMEGEGEVDMEGDESMTRRFGASRSSKWYLMGMPKSVFSPQYYRSMRRPIDSHLNSTQELPGSPSNERRLANAFVMPSSGVSESDKRGRRRSRGKRSANSRASSIKSRSSSVGSMDEDERERRRQLILASRPGGTGMVTLPDGRKVRARRVGEAYSDEEEEENTSEWGLARIARAAERQSFGDVERQTGEKRLSDDEGGRESDFDDGTEEKESNGAMSTMKRRKRGAHDEAEGKNRYNEKGLPVDTTQDTSHDTVLQGTPRKASEEGQLNNLDKTTERDTEESNSDIVTSSEEAVDVEHRLIDKEDAAGEVSQKQLPKQLPKRSITLPSGPITLSASQAAEVRRRHEEEVAALGAEVLQSIAQSKKAKQMQIDQQQAAHRQPQQSQQQRGTVGEHGKHVHHENKMFRSHTMHVGGTPSTSAGSSSKVNAESSIPHSERNRGRERLTRTQSSVADEQGTSKKHSRHSRISPLPHSLRSKARTQSVHVLNAQNHADADRPNSHDTRESLRKVTHKEVGSTPSAPIHLSRTSTPPRIQTDSTKGDDRPSTPTKTTTSPLNIEDDDAPADLTASISSVRTLRGIGSRSPQIEDPVVQSSPLSKVAANANSFQSFVEPDKILKTTESPESLQIELEDADITIDSQAVASSTSSLRTASVHSVRRPRIPDLPSPWDLPRRPDVRGYAVVPLPGSQLGRRPERPLEGRVWRTDEEQEEDDDDNEGYSSLEDESPGFGKRHYLRNTPGHEDSDDELDSDLDAEELAEEERRTAVQKKRATTRAAGAELVSGLATKHKSQSQSVSMPNRHRSLSSNRGKDRSVDILGRSPQNLIGKNAEFPISGAPALSRRQGKASVSSNHSQATNRSQKRDSSNDGQSIRPVLSRTIVSASRDRKGLPVAKISRQRDTWNDFDEQEYYCVEQMTAPELVSKTKLIENDLDSTSDVDDLWPPTLDNALGGTPSPLKPDLPPPINIPLKPSTSRPTFSSTSARSASSFSSSIGSGTGVLSSSLGGGGKEAPLPSPGSASHGNHLPASSTSAIRLAMHSTKAKIVREKREKEQKEREQRRKAKEMDESIDFGWPKSLQGSSLY